MNRELVVKLSFGVPSVIVPARYDMWKSPENNFSSPSGKKRIILGTLFICIIVIAWGCSSGELVQNEINHITQINLLESSESSGIDGQWTGAVDGMDGKPLELNYRFKEEDTRLIGLIESKLGGGPISDGKIDGNNIEFWLNAGEGIIILNKGTLSGDEIHMTQTVGEVEMEYVLKRVKR